MPGLSKAEVYSQVLMQAQGLLSGQRNWVSVHCGGYLQQPHLIFYLQNGDNSLIIHHVNRLGEQQTLRTS